jgi:hypothetical protein
MDNNGILAAETRQKAAADKIGLASIFLAHCMPQSA